MTLGGAREARDAGERAATSSLGELMGGVTRDLSKLIRQEVQLAKAELRESASKAGKGAGLYSAAGIAGHMALLFVTLAAWWALGDAIESLPWAGVIVAVVYGVVALVLFLVGRRQFASMTGLSQTADTVKKIPEALKPEEVQ